MTLQTVKSPVDEALSSLIAAQQVVLPGTAGFSRKRAAASAQFASAGLPNKRVEAWKYSDLKRAMPADIALIAPLEGNDVEGRLTQTRIFTSVERARLIIINGVFRADLSDMALLDGKLSVRTVADSLRDGTFVLDDPEIASQDMALALNTALLQDGVVLEIADNVELETPIEIRNVMIGTGLATTRNRVVVGSGAKATFIETFVGDDGAHQLNAAIDYRVGDQAKVCVTRVINDGAEAIHVGSTTIVLGGETRFEHFTMSTGGSFTRSQSFVRFEGEHSDAELFGATIIEGKQHSDITLTVDHAVPNCNSKEQYRTVMADKAAGVFQGKIIVRQPAQKTDGQMMSQALLLSEDAAFYNKPELEIFADDVQCAHGATCGELDEDLLFYLRARGIPREQAEKMLVMAFLAEVVEHCTNAQFVEALESYISNWLGLEQED